MTTTLKYYSLGGQTVMRNEEGLKYLLTDHLSSVELQRLIPQGINVSLEWRFAAGGRQRAAVTDEDGDLVQQTRYLPYGGVPGTMFPGHPMPALCSGGTPRVCHDVRMLAWAVRGMWGT